MTKIIYEYSAEKNQQLINECHISFEEVVAVLEDGKLLDVISHPNKGKYPNQQVIVVQIKEYIYLVPFVQKDNKTIFLKTIFPSRRAKKRYMKGEVSNEN